MKAKVNKFYVLRTDNYYFSVDLQRNVKFDSKLIVKCTNHYGYNDTGHFGIILDNFGMSNYETKNQIQFSDSDIIKEYDYNSNLPLFYMDFQSGI